MTLVKPGANQESSDCGSLEEPLAQRLGCWALSAQALTWHPESSYLVPPRGANTAWGFEAAIEEVPAGLPSANVELQKPLLVLKPELVLGTELGYDRTSS